MATGTEAMGNGVKMIGETCLPGASLLIDGDFKGGGLHVVGGLLARWALGPIGWLAFATNSFSKSLTTKNLHEHFIGAGSTTKK